MHYKLIRKLKYNSTLPSVLSIGESISHLGFLFHSKRFLGFRNKMPQNLEFRVKFSSADNAAAAQ